MAASRERLSQEQISQAQKRLAETVTALSLDEQSQAMVDRAHKLPQSVSIQPGRPKVPEQLPQSKKLETQETADLTQVLEMIDQARRRGDQVELDNWLEELTDMLYDLEE